MATYPVVNTKTGDKKEVSMSVHDWDQWCTDNPEWSRDYSDPSTCPMAAEAVSYTHLTLPTILLV